MVLDGSLYEEFQSTPTPIKINSKLAGWTLQDIACLMVILVVTPMLFRENYQCISSYMGNNSEMAEPIMTSLNGMNFRVNMITEKQELLQKLSDDKMHNMRKELERYIERELSNNTSKIASIQIELSNISRAQNEISSKMEKKFSDVEKKIYHLEELVNYLSISGRSPTEYHDISLSSRKLSSVRNRLCNYFFGEEELVR